MSHDFEAVFSRIADLAMERKRVKHVTMSKLRDTTSAVGYISLRFPVCPKCGGPRMRLYDHNHCIPCYRKMQNAAKKRWSVRQKTG